MKFSKEQTTAINEAIAAAESQTAAEIIPVVAQSSGRYDRAEDVFGVLLATLAVVVLYLALPIFHPTLAEGSWGGTSALGQAGILAAILLGSFTVGAILATRIPALRLLFVSKKQMAAEVQRRAEQFFTTASLRRTQGATGVLLYVSLFERRAVVLADEGAQQALCQTQLAELCDMLVAGFKAGQGAGGVIKAISTAGEMLAEPLPRAEDDVNELPDQLIVLGNV